VPARCVSNEDLIANGVPSDADCIQENLGIERRHIVETEQTSDLAYEAAEHRRDKGPVDGTGVPGTSAVLLGAPAGGAVPSSALGLTSMGTGPNSG
jgi:hypothetical protein